MAAAVAAAAVAAAGLVVPPNLTKLSDALAALRPVVAANHHEDVRNDLLLTSLDGAVASKELLSTFGEMKVFQVSNGYVLGFRARPKGVALWRHASQTVRLTCEWCIRAFSLPVMAELAKKGSKKPKLGLMLPYLLTILARVDGAGPVPVPAGDQLDLDGAVEDDVAAQVLEAERQIWDALVATADEEGVVEKMAKHFYGYKERGATVPAKATRPMTAALRALVEAGKRLLLSKKASDRSRSPHRDPLDLHDEREGDGRRRSRRDRSPSVEPEHKAEPRGGTDTTLLLSEERKQALRAMSNKHNSDDEHGDAIAILHVRIHEPACSLLPACCAPLGPSFLSGECTPAAFGQKRVTHSTALRGVALCLCPQGLKEMISTKTVADAHIFLRPTPGKGQNIMKMYVAFGRVSCLCLPRGLCPFCRSRFAAFGLTCIRACAARGVLERLRWQAGEWGSHEADHPLR